jgi:hypothetical protein
MPSDELTVKLLFLSFGSPFVFLHVLSSFCSISASPLRDLSVIFRAFTSKAHLFAFLFDDHLITHSFVTLTLTSGELLTTMHNNSLLPLLPLFAEPVAASAASAAGAAAERGVPDIGHDQHGAGLACFFLLACH